MSRKPRRVVREDEVLGIFQMKANGKSGVDIADAVGCSDTQISQILHRKIHGDVDVPDHLVETVNKMLVKGRRTATRRSRPSTLQSEAEAVTEYTKACYALLSAEEKCRAAGVEEDQLSSLLHVITRKRHL